MYGANDPANGILFYLYEAGAVRNWTGLEIDGFYFQGDNPSFTGDSSAAWGILGGKPAILQNSRIVNNIFENFTSSDAYAAGVYLYNADFYSAAAAGGSYVGANNLIAFNKFHNNYAGIVVLFDWYGSITVSPLIALTGDDWV